jgi:hypothetical protein
MMTDVNLDVPSTSSCDLTSSQHTSEHPDSPQGSYLELSLTGESANSAQELDAVEDRSNKKELYSEYYYTSSIKSTSEIHKRCMSPENLAVEDKGYKNMTFDLADELEREEVLQAKNLNMGSTIYSCFDEDYVYD